MSLEKELRREGLTISKALKKQIRSKARVARLNRNKNLRKARAFAKEHRNPKTGVWDSAINRKLFRDVYVKRDIGFFRTIERLSPRKPVSFDPY